MGGITRRSLLKGAFSALVPLTLPSAARSAPGLRAGTSRPRVVEVEGPVEEALARLLEELGGIGRFVRPGETVLVKPNMSFPYPPERAVTTDPGLVRAMVLQCLEAGASTVLVADHPMRAAGPCVDLTGMKKACAGLRHVHLIAATREGMFRRVRVPGGTVLRETKVLRAALDADVLINLPRMKSHGATTVSLGLKGNMGLIWDRRCFHGRLDLDQALGDLNKVIRARLTVLDGSRVLTAGGPTGPGPVLDLGCLIGGTDPVAVDAYAVERVAWYGKRMEADRIPHLRTCHARGLGEIDTTRMEIVRRRVSVS